VLDETALLNRLEQLYEIEKEITRYNIIIPLMMLMYNAVLRRRLEAMGVDFRSFDLTEGMLELKSYDPGISLEALHGLFVQLRPEVQPLILSGDAHSFSDMTELDEFQRAFADFLDRFGHLSDNSNDFSSVPWRESPGVVLNLINEYDRPEESTMGKVRLADLSLQGIKGRSFRVFYKRARQFRLYREQISSLHTFGLGLLRAYYLALGERLTQRGWLDCPDDIFYLYRTEITQAVNGAQAGDQLLQLVAKRRHEIDEARDVQLPEIIFGDQPPPIIPSNLGRYRGTPTSPGYYTGRIKVIRGVADFSKLEPGDVLIIPYSDVGWMPLFAKAGAVVAESGGILSHSSIIAREYNIPAVVSVNGAMNLPDRTLVTVDGFQGEIIIHGESNG
jgi:pyruvate,water dikinase